MRTRKTNEERISKISELEVIRRDRKIKEDRRKETKKGEIKVTRRSKRRNEK